MVIKETLITGQLPPRNDLYDHYYFSETSDPGLVEIARRVQADGYTTMGFVSGDAVAPDGTLIDSIDHSRGDYTDYYLAVSPSNANDKATMRKINLPPYGSVEDLPAYALSKEGLLRGSLERLHDMQRHSLNIKEIAGLARTREASPIGVYELLRDVLQESLGRDEVWFFSIVSGTYDSLTKYFGKSAFSIIGEDVKINDPRVDEKVLLKPVLLFPDHLFESMIYDVENSSNVRERRKILNMFLYFTEGLTETTMGEYVSNYRQLAMSQDRQNKVS